MLHMSSTHQMQQIHPNDLTLICPYVAVMGVGVRSETGSEQAKKTQPVNGYGQFSEKYDSGPPPNPYISEKPYSRAFQIYPTYPYLPNTQLAEMRQQGQQAAKTQKVGRNPGVPERYVELPKVPPPDPPWLVFGSCHLSPERGQGGFRRGSDDPHPYPVQTFFQAPLGWR